MAGRARCVATATSKDTAGCVIATSSILACGFGGGAAVCLSCVQACANYRFAKLVTKFPGDS